MSIPSPVTIIGGGMAGCEAAWQLAKRGVGVRLYEMRPTRTTPVHHTGDLAEMVCSNSLRSDGLDNAVGLLHEEMRRLDSIFLGSADNNRVPAGKALAVDRRRFAREVSSLRKLRHRNLISVVDAGSEGQHPWVAMELVTGETLQARINREGQLPIREALDFGRQLRQARDPDAEAPEDVASALDFYLSPGNRERVARGCTIVSNAADVARGSARARRAFTRAFEDMRDEFRTIAEDASEDPDAGALAAIATSVGGVVLARALADEGLVEELLAACRSAVARQLGESEEGR